MPRRPNQDTKAYPSAQRISTWLGWFSLGIGVAELLAPRAAVRSGVVRGAGLRELATGAGILLAPSAKRGPWLWGRVLGDAVDVLALARAVKRGNPRRWQSLVTLVSVIGVTAVDLTVARMATRPERSGRYADRHGLPGLAAGRTDRLAASNDGRDDRRF